MVIRNSLTWKKLFSTFLVLVSVSLWHGYKRETLWIQKGDSMDTKGRHYGYKRETLWIQKGDTMDTKGRHYGYKRETLWIQKGDTGYKRETLRIQKGDTMDTKGRHYGYKREILWIQKGDTLWIQKGDTMDTKGRHYGYKRDTMDTKGRHYGHLHNIPATCKCISGTDLLNFTCCHTDRSCRPNCPSHPVTVYWHRANLAPGRVATGMPIFQSLVWLYPKKILAQAGFEPGIFLSRGGHLNQYANQVVKRERNIIVNYLK